MSEIFHISRVVLVFSNYFSPLSCLYSVSFTVASFFVALLVLAFIIAFAHYHCCSKLLFPHLHIWNALLHSAY